MSGSPGVVVREARADDVPAIGAMAGRLYALHHGWDAERFWNLGGDDGARAAGREAFFRSQVDAEDVILLVADRGGEVVGYAYLSVEAHDYEHLLEAAVWLNDLWVEERARGSGAADALFDEARRRAAKTGHRTFVLNVAEANTRAQRFFARHGMRVTMREMASELGED